MDIIPNDICPTLFHQITTLTLDNDKYRFEDLEVDMLYLPQKQYEYTFSLTV